jgi:hypothetical protein
MRSGPHDAVYNRRAGAGGGNGPPPAAVSTGRTVRPDR